MFVIHERYGLHKCGQSTLFRDHVDFAIATHPSSSLSLLRVPLRKPLTDVEVKFCHLPRAIRRAVVILPAPYLRIQPLYMLFNGLYPRLWRRQSLLDDISNMLLGFLAEPLLGRVIYPSLRCLRLRLAMVHTQKVEPFFTRP